MYTLSKISNWSPYVFMLVLKLRFGIQNSCFYKSTKALRRFCRSFHLQMTVTSCTDDARVKVPSHFFYNMKYSTETPSICIFLCLKMFLTAVINEEHASNDLRTEKALMSMSICAGSREPLSLDNVLAHFYL